MIESKKKNSFNFQSMVNVYCSTQNIIVDIYFYLCIYFICVWYMYMCVRLCLRMLGYVWCVFLYCCIPCSLFCLSKNLIQEELLLTSRWNLVDMLLRCSGFFYGHPNDVKTQNTTLLECSASNMNLGLTE